MTDAEAIQSVRDGKRAKTDTSLHDADKPGLCGYVHQWRVIACDSETDVVECANCGRQKLAKCNFDEECT